MYDDRYFWMWVKGGIQCYTYDYMTIGQHAYMYTLNVSIHSNMYS